MMQKKAPKRGTGKTKGEGVDDAVSRRLREYYASVTDEAIPDRFLDLLEKLDAADRAHRASTQQEADSRE